MQLVVVDKNVLFTFTKCTEQVSNPQLVMLSVVLCSCMAMLRASRIDLFGACLISGVICNYVDKKYN